MLTLKNLKFEKLNFVDIEARIKSQLKQPFLQPETYSPLPYDPFQYEMQRISQQQERYMGYFTNKTFFKIPY